ncbi:MAG: excisionase family DNA-binding protein [Actinomycetota bacterium]
MPAATLAPPACLTLLGPIEHAPQTVIAPPVRLALQEAVARGFGGYSTLRKKIASGELPAERVGRRYLILESDLKAMVAPVVGRPTEHATISAAIDRLVASAPRLSREQRERLAGVLGGGAA